MGQETSKYDNQKYTGATRLDDGETYDTYRDKNKVERYDDSKNKRTLLPTFSAKKIQPPAVLARDRAEENRPKSMKKFAKGGNVKQPKNSDAGESPAMVKKEMAFMERKGAPKSMIKHEKEEAKGMNCGGGVKKMAVGGIAQTTARSRLGGNVPAGGSMAAPGYYRSPLASPGGPAGRLGMPGGKPQVKPLKKGGGIEQRGKTEGKIIKAYKKGGMIDGCAVRGKTKGKVC